MHCLLSQLILLLVDKEKRAPSKTLANCTETAMSEVAYNSTGHCCSLVVANILLTVLSALWFHGCVKPLHLTI